MFDFFRNIQKSYFINSCQIDIEVFDDRVNIVVHCLNWPINRDQKFFQKFSHCFLRFCYQRFQAASFDQRVSIAPNDWQTGTLGLWFFRQYCHHFQRCCYHFCRFFYQSLFNFTPIFINFDIVFLRSLDIVFWEFLNCFC